MKMKMRMTNLSYVRLQERNRSKKDVIKPLMTKTLHLWFLQDLRPPQVMQRQKRKGPPVWQARSNCYTETRGVKGLARATRGCPPRSSRRGPLIWIFPGFFLRPLSTRGEDMPVLQFRKTETGKISRERTSCRRIWRPHLFRSWVGKD